jgi:amidase
MLDRGQVGASELLARHLERLDEVNPALNAVVHTDRPGAIEAAGDADAAAAASGYRPLLGIPMTVKEHIGVAGMPATSGDPARTGMWSAADAPCTARLRAAGAVLVGKTNQSIHGRDWQTDNPVYGLTRNPWDLARTPGGSSGGGAAAVAAGIVPVDLGTDTAGSLRIPAAFCGVYAHRPTTGTVAGAAPSPSRALSLPRLTEVGPIARSAEDLGVLHDVLSGGCDRTPPVESLRRLRVAFLVLPSWFGLHCDVDAAYHRVADALAPVAAEVAWRTPELPGGLEGLYDTFLKVVAATGARLTPRREREEFAATLRAGGDPRDAAWVEGLFATTADRADWTRHRDGLRAALGDFFGRWDVLVAPAATSVAFEHAPGHPNDWFSRLDLGDRSGRYNDLFFVGALASLPGLPATVFPAGLSPEGLPIGLQVLARPGADRLTIRFADLVADVIGGFVAPSSVYASYGPVTVGRVA